MRTVLYLILVIVVFSCRSSIEQNKSGAANKQKSIFTEEEIVSSALIAEINSFVNYMDSLSEKGFYNPEVFLVLFDKNKDSECQVKIITSSYYMKSNLLGYVIIRDKLITFYDTNSCVNSFVKVNKLKQDIPDSFIDENAEESYDPYEPKMRIFKVVGNQLMKM